MTCTALIHQLIEHQAWADAELLRAVAAHPVVASDEKLAGILHHMVVVQRVFTAKLTGGQLDLEKETQAPQSLSELERLYRASRTDLLSFVNGLAEDALDGPVDNPWLPELQGTVIEMLVQVAMHTQNHRGQCLMRLRELAGKAPTLDFIIWVKRGRPGPANAASDGG